jgi:hypothetical protein
MKYKREEERKRWGKRQNTKSAPAAKKSNDFFQSEQGIEE